MVAKKVTRLCSVSIILLLLFLCLGARSEGNQNRLRGVSTVEVIVETSGAVASCGVREEDLYNAVVLPIRAYTKLKITKERLYDYLYLNIGAIKLPNGSCVINYRLELFAIRDVGSTLGRSWPVITQIVLWSGSPTLIIMNEVAYLRNSIERAAKQFATAWFEDNPN
jgi:hypothetical protein